MKVPLAVFAVSEPGMLQQGVHAGKLKAEPCTQQLYEAGLASTRLFPVAAPPDIPLFESPPLPALLAIRSVL